MAGSGLAVAAVKPDGADAGPTGVDGAELASALTALARDHGHDGAVYMHFGHRTARDEQPGPRRLAYSPGFAGERYRRGGWLAHDRWAARARTDHLPFAWRLEEAEPAAGPALDLVRAFRAGGLLGGVIAPVQDYAHGPAMVMLFAAAPHATEPDRHGGLMLDAARLHVLALATRAADAGAEGALNMRELDVLRLAALGRTERETADLLGLTRRGVQFHLARAMTKLEVGNKTAAVAQVVGAGLIRL